MSSKLPITFFIILLSLFLVATAIPGGRTKVKNVKKDTEIQQLGSYSVDEYNRLQRTKKTGAGAGDLKFSQVVAAETQVVAGTKYYLKIEAVTKGGKVKVFDAEVVVQPWKHSKKLLGFKPAPVQKICG
ncbi:putative Cystatin domain-containing protein [Helianthus debilis subsp. tardiflorus]